ncbi:MAG: MotA/TolQ/ExbB proton channel family protein [Roseivirga sp.]|nr:MotA/TolQ/ExbB proton channel family protein [Roseivirga sp.]
MLEIFYSGERLFMGIITISALAMLTLAVLCLRALLMGQISDQLVTKIGRIREIGLFALVIGLFASTLDLVAAFSAIQMAGDITMSLLAAGLKLTMISTVYGLMVYGLAVLISMLLNWRVSRLAA